MPATTSGFPRGKAAIAVFLCFTLMSGAARLSADSGGADFPRMAIAPVPVGGDPGAEETAGFLAAAESLRD
ncbi:MAG: hypothetical protein ACLFRP_08825, partial [Puniceicoccaceae bacterium]